MNTTPANRLFQPTAETEADYSRAMSNLREQGFEFEVLTDDTAWAFAPVTSAIPEHGNMTHSGSEAPVAVAATAA